MCKVTEEQPQYNTNYHAPYLMSFNVFKNVNLSNKSDQYASAFNKAKRKKNRWLQQQQKRLVSCRLNNDPTEKSTNITMDKTECYYRWSRLHFQHRQSKVPESRQMWMYLLPHI